MKVLIGVVGILLFAGAAWGGDFTDNLNGTVSDNVTGLIWQQEDDNSTRTWEKAITYCENLTLATHADWRLPNVNELESLVDREQYNPAIDSVAFPNTNSSGYWSSTTYAGDTGYAWGVLFGHGNVYSLYYKTNNLYARCVRGGQ